MQIHETDKCKSVTKKRQSQANRELTLGFLLALILNASRGAKLSGLTAVQSTEFEFVNQI
jgi:hypothetical protein